MTPGLRPGTLKEQKPDAQARSGRGKRGPMNEPKTEQEQNAKPKKPRSTKRKRQYGIHLRLTAEEDAKLRGKALKAGKKPGDLLRAWIADKEIKAAQPEGFYRKVVGLATNINQLTRAVNSGEIPNNEETNALISLCKEIKEIASR
jgi:hypothetical protein